MRLRLLATPLAMACCLSLPVAAMAKGGQHGGHSSGGHSGGHSSGGRSGSHGSGGHSHAGTASRGASSHGPEARGTSSTHAATTGPAGARSRDRRPVTGTAVPRTGAPFIAHPLLYSPYRFAPYYHRPFGFGGLGLYYDPFWSGYGFGSYGYPGYMYNADPEYMYPYPGDPPASYAPSSPPAQSGNLRLLIEPPAAQVYVDGSFAGTVEEVGSALTGLTLAAGPHRIELRAPGYEPLTVDVTIAVDRTITYRGEMRRIPPR